MVNKNYYLTDIKKNGIKGDGIVKIYLKRFSAYILALILVFTTTGCNNFNRVTEASSDNSAANSTSKPSENLTKSSVSIGLSLPNQQEERWVKDRKTIEAESKALGIDLKVQVADSDAVKQDSQCESLISQGIKVLILVPHDARSSTSIIEKAHKAGIKVISYDRLVMGADVDLYLSFDNIKVGELQGEYLTQKVPQGNYVVLSGSPSDNNAYLFKQGAMKYIQPLVDKGDVKIVMEEPVTDWLPSEALKLMKNALTNNQNKIDAVLAPNDGTAGSCIQALAEQKLDGKVPVTGQDSDLLAAQRIVKGTQSMTVFKDTRELGKEAVKLALKMLNGENIETTHKVNNEKIDVPSILLSPVRVDKDNIDEVLIDSGYLKKEDVYID